MTRRAIMLGVLFLLGIGLVGATTLVKMDVEHLTRNADKIVVGTVTDVQSSWGPNSIFIHTDVTIDIERSLQGKASKQIVLRNPGGIIDGQGQRADGAATFEVGERVMLFLTTWEDGTAKVLGYTQGKSRIVADSQGGQRLVGGSAHGLSVSGAELEIQQGSDQNLQLLPAR